MANKTMNRLRAVREANGLTQIELATRIGISDSLLRAFEAGRAKPSPRVAELLHSTFGEPADQLLKPAKIERLPQIQSQRYTAAAAQP